MTSKEKLSSSFQPLHGLLQLIGLIPLDSKLIGTCYSSLLLVMTVFCTGQCIGTFAWAFTRKAVDWTTQDYVVSVLEVLSAGVCLMTLLTTSLCDRGHHLQDVYMRIQEHDELTRLGGSNTSLQRDVALEVMAVVVVLLVMLRWDWQLINAAFTHVFLVIVYLSYFAQGLTVVHFVNLVLAIKRRALEINARLVELSKAVAMKTDGKKALNNFSPHTDILFGKLPATNFASSAGNSVESNFVVEIKTLRLQHFKLQQAAYSVNKHFGFKLAGIVLSVIVELICSVYLISSSVFKPNPSDVILKSLVYWCSQKVAAILFITVSSSSVMAESEATSALVLQCSLSLSSVLRCEVAAQLRTLTLQLMGRKMALTAGGLFELDTRLLVDIGATVATYTVVLLTAK